MSVLARCFRRHWLFVCLLVPVAAVGQGRDYGRSMVISSRGIVATSQVLASQAGAQILARGGSAVDAAITANAVLGVTEPMMCGIGGDVFTLYWEAKTGKLTGLNGSGRAPRALTPELLKSKSIEKMPPDGIHSVTVPGAVDGWFRMHQRFGKLPWKDLFAPAIALAEQGFPVPEGIQEAWSGDAAIKKLNGNAESAKVFLPHGAAPAVGALFRNPGMGQALRLIAEQGPAAFYKGEIAKAILATSAKLGGTMTAEDLASFQSEWVEPISTTYRGWRVYELPPNGQGMAALEMLNIMENGPKAEGPYSPVELHKRIEAMKLAYSDLRQYNADPQAVPVPTAGLISKEYGKQRFDLINSQRANCHVSPGVPPRGDTTYFTVVDKEGNIASWIQSIAAGFGSGVTVEGMGFMLHNRGGSFTLEAGHPNVLVGGKRPFHTIIPGFMEKGDQHIGFGIMGGVAQPQAHAQFVSNLVDYGMNVQSALEAPRFLKQSADGCDVAIESRVPFSTLRELTDRGHQVELRRGFNSLFGRGQAILHDAKTGMNFAGSDPRADGAAIPEPMP